MNIPRLLARRRPETFDTRFGNAPRTLSPLGDAPRGDAPLAHVRPLMRRVLECEPWDHSPHAGELECLVRTGAAQLRDLGHLPEQMVIALKRATGRGTRPGFTWNEEDLHYRMILWSVREYFDSEG